MVEIAQNYVLLNYMELDLKKELTEVEKEWIRGLEWLSFDPNHWIDALIQSNALSRNFLCNPFEVYNV